MGPHDPRTMLGLESRPSDSPYVANVWRSAALGGPMTSIAASHREIVFWAEGGEVRVAVRGPETVPTELDVPAGHTSLGIVLTHGAVLPWLPAAALVDAAVQSPATTARGVVLAGEEVPVPGFDDAEAFVERLVRAGVLTRDPMVDDVLRGEPTRLGRRTVERRVRTATGLARGTIGRIERVRAAVALLGDGVAPGEVAGRLGYHDHPHLARSLARFTGYTATGLRTPATALSLAYKVDGLPAL